MPHKSSLTSASSKAVDFRFSLAVYRRRRTFAKIAGALVGAGDGTGSRLNSKYFVRNAGKNGCGKLDVKGCVFNSARVTLAAASPTNSGVTMVFAVQSSDAARD